MIPRKLKQCKTCQTPQYLWAYGNCRDCDGKLKSKEGQGKLVIQVTGTNAELKPFYKKVYSTINKVSDKKLVELADYRKVRDKWLKENPFCEVCGTPYNLSVHHKAGRTGKLLTDIRYFMTVCLRDHEKIETSPEWAKSKGYSLDRLDK